MIQVYCDQCGKHSHDVSPGTEKMNAQFAYAYVMGYYPLPEPYEFCSWECMKEHMRSMVFREVPVGASS